MGRKKLDRAYISDGMMRATTFKHRKKGLIKKLDELKVLCDVAACAVIHEPFNNLNPEVWPSKPEAINVIEKFEMLPEKEKKCKSVTHEEFLIQEIKKVKKRTLNLTEGNKEIYMKELMFGCLRGNMEGLTMQNSDPNDLVNFIDQYLKDLNHHKNVILNNPPFEIGESSSMATPRNMEPAPTTAVMEQIATAESGSFSSVSMLHSIISSTSEPQHANSLASNYLNASTLNSPQFEISQSSSIATAWTAVTAPPATAESGSFSFVKLLQSVMASNPRPEHVNSLASNYLNAPTLKSLQVTSQLTPGIPSNQIVAHDNSVASNPLPSSDQEVYVPAKNEDEFYNPYQNQDQQIVEEMLKLGEKTGFPWMEDNDQF
ncbi:unnamed protein product [Thlaspi arvense]|uniref:MADS-box domain-containing protein n=1 Tax=Thlaspi arvense TaxID=13288 RepID=A0AAU9RQ11_THLAR|nr:unnamed protein product [Thlaspi arvense]